MHIPPRNHAATFCAATFSFVVPVTIIFRFIKRNFIVSYLIIFIAPVVVWEFKIFANLDYLVLRYEPSTVTINHFFDMHLIT